MAGSNKAQRGKAAPRKIEKSDWLLIALLILLMVLGVFRSGISAFLWENFKVSAPALLFNGDPDILFAVGQYNFNGGVYNISTAEKAYKEVLKLNPSYPFVNYQLGRISLVKNRPLTATAFLSEELKLYPDHYRAYYVRGLMKGFANDLVGAEEDFKTFVSAYPDEWAGYNDLAWVLLKEKKWTEAKDIIQKAFVSTGDKENPWLWNSLGVAELNLHNYGAAKAAFLRALAAASSLTESDWARAYPGNNPKEAAGGLRDFKEAISKNIEFIESKLVSQ